MRPSTAPTTPAVGSYLGNLAMIHGGVGQLEQARALAERALTIDEAVNGPDHPTVAIIRSNLTQILHGLE
jgi:hypothetical protein